MNAGGSTNGAAGIRLAYQLAEQAFIDECRELLGDKTVILITHRPQSLALADRVLHLEGVGKP